MYVDAVWHKMVGECLGDPLVLLDQSVVVEEEVVVEMAEGVVIVVGSIDVVVIVVSQGMPNDTSHLLVVI